jgi:hypothetical protein
MIQLKTQSRPRDYREFAAVSSNKLLFSDKPTGSREFLR